MLGFCGNELRLPLLPLTEAHREPLRAALQTAGVLPIGVIAPGDDPDSTTRSLQRAGAAAVLNNTTEILEALP